jgi:hypothetical protein
MLKSYSWIGDLSRQMQKQFNDHLIFEYLLLKIIGISLGGLSEKLIAERIQ